MHLKKTAVVLFLICHLQGTVAPAEVRPIVKDLLEDEAHIWTSPFRWQAKDFILCGALMTVVGITIAHDEEIYREIKKVQNRNPWIDSVSPVVTELGNWGVNLAIDSVLYLGGLVLRDERAKETAVLGLETLIHTGIVVQVFKHLMGRQRPEIENGQDWWFGPEGLIKRYTGDLRHYDSFPSGHTITAWGLATVIAEMYRHRWYIPVTCYTLATLAGLSRITEDKHWLSDVIVGAVLGYTIAKYVVTKRRKPDSRLIVGPTMSSNGFGLGISYVF